MSGTKLDTGAAVSQREGATGTGASLGSLGETPNDPTPRPQRALARLDPDKA